MSEENLNNGNTEETAALFVSAQKKKKAEEEAKRKAAEEKAAREAAEAELRRMEQEVEERKRKEEEKHARRRMFGGKAKKSKEKDIQTSGAGDGEAGGTTTGGKKSKKPLFIGIGAVVVLLFFILGLPGGGGSSSGSEADLSAEFNQEFMAQDPAYDIRIRYPDSLFSEVMELGSPEEGEYDVSFPTPDNGGIGGGLQFDDLTSDTGYKVTKGILGSISAKVIASSMTSYTKKVLENNLDQVEILSEELCDITAEDPGNYLYSCTYQYPDEGGKPVSGASTTWLAANSSGEYKYVNFFCQKSGEDTDSLKELCRRFAEENAGDALKIPGGNPPASAEAGELLEVEGLHMGIPVPAGRFEKNPNPQMYEMWSDENGASIISQYTDLEMSRDQAKKSLDKNRDKWLDSFKNSLAAGGLNNFLSSVENRMFVIDYTYPSDVKDCAYYADYKDVVGGITCWERYFVSFWYDETAQKSFISVLIFLVPEANHEEYQPIVENAIANLSDL